MTIGKFTVTLLDLVRLLSELEVTIAAYFVFAMITFQRILKELYADTNKCAAYFRRRKDTTLPF